MSIKNLELKDLPDPLAFDVMKKTIQRNESDSNSCKHDRVVNTYQGTLYCLRCNDEIPEEPIKKCPTCKKLLLDHHDEISVKYTGECMACDHLRAEELENH